MAALTPRRCPRFISPSRLSSASAIAPTPPQGENDSREIIGLPQIPKTNCKSIHNDSDKPPSMTLDMLRKHLRNVNKVRDNLTNAVTYLGTINVEFPNPGRYFPDYHRLLNSLASRKAVKPETTSDPPNHIRAAESAKSTVFRAEHRKVVSKKKTKLDDTEQQPLQSVPFEEAMQETHDSVQSFYNNSANVVSFSGSATTDDFKVVETAEPKEKFKSKSEVILNEYLGFFGKFAKIMDSSGEKKAERIPVIRKDFVSRAALSQRTKSLVASLKTCSTDASRAVRTEELCKHLLESPESRSVATKAGVLPLLLRMRNSTDRELSGAAREALALVGYVDPVKGRGIRILSVDGGGTKGLVAIETMRQLEAACRRDITELFDLVYGVSTGALILAMVFMFHVPLDRCEHLYKQLSTQMFTRNRFVGTGKLVWSHAFYDTDIWENILKENLGEELMIRLTRDPAVPKMACSSCLMNAPKLKNFIFRNYNLPPEVFSRHPGNCKQRVWEAIRASSAAPGYYEDFKIGDFIHQDGGVLSNNPSALAIHEGKLLWPQESIQCVISLGNGRHEPSLELSTGSKVTLKDKVSKIVDSATDTEAVHTTLQDLMAPSTYFRFNPYLSEDFMLDEIRPDKQVCMQRDAQLYLRKNDLKIERAAEQLLQPRRLHQRAADWLKLTADKM